MPFRGTIVGLRKYNYLESKILLPLYVFNYYHHIVISYKVLMNHNIKYVIRSICSINT